jgi:hypothetical protein
MGLKSKWALSESEKLVINIALRATLGKTKWMMIMAIITIMTEIMISLQ